MIKKGEQMYRFLIFLIPLCFLFFLCQPQQDSLKVDQGLIGAYYGNADFTRIKEAEVLKHLDKVWDEETGHGSSWSGIWEGMIVAPVSDLITFTLSTTQSATLKITPGTKITIKDGPGTTEMTMEMIKGKAYPIKIYYSHAKGGEGRLAVKWGWSETTMSSIPRDNIYFTAEQAANWNWVIEPDSQSIDFSQLLRVPSENVVVYYQPGRFCGWPANNGVWIWGDEILVGFTLAYYQEKELHHSVDETKPSQSVLARSLDGGQTWKLEEPENFLGQRGEAKTLTKAIRFNDPNFALRSREQNFFFSYDRGKTWKGPFRYPDLVGKKITSRTDYQVISKKNCLFFLSAEEEQVQARLQDRAFCALTTDGGISFKFLGWMTDSVSVRSVMPSTVRIGNMHFISALRRRYDQKYENKPNSPRNWIDVYESRDNGNSWQFLSKVSNTDRGKHNGNPPSLVRLKDGRLCVTYAFRGVPYGIRARISSDNGQTWGEEIHLRDDGRTFDLGYTRSVQRNDGKIVTIYYYTTQELKEQHIAATIWNPDHFFRGHRQ